MTLETGFYIPWRSSFNPYEQKHYDITVFFKCYPTMQVILFYLHRLWDLRLLPSAFLQFKSHLKTSTAAFTSKHNFRVYWDKPQASLWTVFTRTAVSSWKHPTDLFTIKINGDNVSENRCNGAKLCFLLVSLILLGAAKDNNHVHEPNMPSLLNWLTVRYCHFDPTLPVVWNVRYICPAVFGSDITTV